MTTPDAASTGSRPEESEWVRPFTDLGMADVPEVGGKNASLGEMISELAEAGIRVPEGFATTAAAYRAFLEHNDLGPRLRELLAKLDDGSATLEDTGRSVREAILGGELQPELVDALRTAYRTLEEETPGDAPAVAVRSSATAEDLPEASFAGQQESFLNVVGEEALLEACLRCYASLFTDRAISYRAGRDFDHLDVALSVGVQRMIRSDLAGAGVLFTLDPDSGFPRVIVLNAAWGLGESVVKGTVNPDQHTVFKPLLDDGDARPILERVAGSKEEKVIYRSGGGSESVPTTEEERRSLVLDDDEVLTLARWGVEIERHYGRPMDIEWAKDGEDGLLYIVQARPETVEARKKLGVVETFTLKERPDPLISGVAVGNSIVTATAYRIESPSELANFPEGGVLVASRTDPDWGPGLARAAGVVTDQGGRTSHAAIVSRELGIPAVVGTGSATEVVPHGEEVTLSCAEGDRGHVYPGALDFERTEVDLENMPEPRTRIMLNVGNPEAAFRWWRLPARGIGLARIEFVIGEVIRIHPLALVHPEQVPEGAERDEIERLLAGWDDRREYFVDLLARGIARLAAAAHPHPAVVRTSDFKSNEYATLLGGSAFEPVEENPMIGLRGASRYYSELYREAFLLECEALRRVRADVGLKNVVPMIPFCRTPAEADRVLDLMAGAGLKRGEDDLKIFIMCEIPSNVVVAEAFAERFDGFSIGSNDLTQLVLGVDRDSAELAHLFDEDDEAVKSMISDVIGRCAEAGISIGICGQAPSDRKGFAEFLVNEGIDSMSLNPDSIVDVVRRVAALEGA